MEARVVGGIVVGATVALGAFVYVFAAVGQPFVDGLDERVGEIVSARADRLARGFRYDEAIALYRQALDTKFQSEPLQRMYTLEKLMAALEAVERYDEAIDAGHAALAIRWNYSPAFARLYRLLRETERYEDAIALLEAHHEKAEAAHDIEQMLMAKLNEGVVYEAMGRRDEALGAYLACYAKLPRSRYALKVAELYCARGGADDAKSYLDYVFENGNYHQKRRAKAIAAACGAE
jgi:tetratricopeptide (TPR) repeat protein